MLCEHPNIRTSEHPNIQTAEISTPEVRRPQRRRAPPSAPHFTDARRRALFTSRAVPVPLPAGYSAYCLPARRRSFPFRDGGAQCDRFSFLWTSTRSVCPVPAWLGLLIALQQVYLRENQLTSVPKELG